MTRFHILLNGQEKRNQSIRNIIKEKYIFTDLIQITKKKNPNVNIFDAFTFISGRLINGVVRFINVVVD